MIPPFSANGALPPGVRPTTWQEIVDRFGWTSRRRELLDGLRLAIDDLRAAGCRTVYVDGSFVTSKDEPGDFDACWDRTGVNPDALHPALVAYDAVRLGMKARYGGELVLADTAADLYGTTYLDYFQRDKDTDEPRGIVVIDIEAGL